MNHCHWGFTLALTIVLGLGGTAGSAAAQTRFEWPDTAIDLAHYTRLEDCMALMERVTRTEDVGEYVTTGIWRDTLPDDPRRNALRRLPEPVTTSARRCTAQFPEPVTPLEHYRYFLKLYLQANRDADVAALVARRLAAAPATDTAVRTAVVDTARLAYWNAQPMRIATIERIFEERLGRAPGLPARIGLRYQLMDLAMRLADTAQALAHAKEIVADWERTPVAERGDADGMAVWAALRGLHYREMLDSLRRSTASYNAFGRALAVRAFGPAFADTTDTNITKQLRFAMYWAHTLGGQPAPPVVGDFWFRRGDSAAARPARGKIGLVVFIRPSQAGREDQSGEPHPCLPVKATREDLGGDSHKCWQTYVSLRRLAQRFPELEITVVTRALGHFVYRTLPPAEEAEMIRHWLHDVHKLPGALAVETGPVLRLPDPDRRRLYRANTNESNYDGNGNLFVGTGFLVNRDGMIMHVGVGDLEDTYYGSPFLRFKFPELIEALQQQPQSAGSRPPGPAS